MGKILAILLIVLGLGGGLVAGTLLRPASTPLGPDRAGSDRAGSDRAGADQGGADDMRAGNAAAAATKMRSADAGSEKVDGEPHGLDAVRADHANDTAFYPSDEHGGNGTGPPSEREYVNVGRQVIIPIVAGGETQALMLFDLALDVPEGMSERVHAIEPRLRDAFLRVLFEMSYTGAFSGTYTDERVVGELRGKLRRAARGFLGDAVADVLILDIMRQEL